MKSKMANGKLARNGHYFTSDELFAAHGRSLSHDKKLGAKAGFETLVKAGIYTRGGKLKRRYGGPR
jgi:hypothetical protein